MGDNTIKQIIINPELFNISNRRHNKTPKNRRFVEHNSQNTTVTRNPKTKILKHIQNIYNQEKKEKKRNILKNLFNNNVNKFNNELDESIDYLLNISKNNEEINKHSLETNKQSFLNINPDNTNNNNDDTDNDDTNNDDTNNDDTNNDDTEWVDDTNNDNHSQQIIEYLKNQNEIPKYGCLRNGKLPTYKNYKQMLKNPRNSISTLNKVSENQNIKVNPIININTPFAKGEDGLKKFLNFETNKQSTANNNETITTNNNQTINSQTINNNITNDSLNKVVNKINRKKIIRRTFRLGKNKKESKIGVLISNKTIRNQVKNKMKEIYQLPIGDIKKFLIKKELIKIGSIAPTDILREMYKNVIMLCGDLQNHNTENILYNYVNSQK